jgi:proteasome lid subunit RPN8/RPN11
MASIWQPPQCPFPIEWSAAALDPIRIAATDAFFSIPHGGAEIGGVLFGTRKEGRVLILAARPLECEHAFGPTFILSDADHGRLRALLDEGCRDLRAQGVEAVGWYHSHTRSEIFLSAQDIEIHNRYFPNPWEVALVVRPHRTRPMRAGFFFREAGGAIHADSTYGEFVLTAPAARSAEPPPESTVAVSIPDNPPKQSLPWPWWVATVLVLALSTVFYQSDWLRPPPPPAPPSISLMAYDIDGQLQIHWDRQAAPIRSATSGTLEIKDGAALTVVTLESQRLRNGTVSYARAGSRVDLRLTLEQPGHPKFEECTTFVGHPLPKRRP